MGHGMVQGSQVERLHKVSRLFADVSSFLKGIEKDRDLRNFHRNLDVLCRLLMTHTSHASNHHHNPILGMLLGIFDSMVVDKCCESHGAVDPTSEHFRLTCLHGLWMKLCNEPEAERMALIQRMLHYGASAEERDCIIDSLNELDTQLAAQLPGEEPESVAPQALQPQHQSLIEPPLAVLDGVRELYKVLASSQECLCKLPHKYGARLCLRTYRRHQPATSVPTPSSPTSDDRSCEFDMHLSLVEQFWQEARVKTAFPIKKKHSKVSWGPDLNDETESIASSIASLSTTTTTTTDTSASSTTTTSTAFTASTTATSTTGSLSSTPSPSPNALASKTRRPRKPRTAKRQPITSLCNPLRNARHRTAADRLVFTVEHGQLFKLESERSPSEFDRNKHALSLERILAERPDCLTEKTTRVLAVLLSHSLVYLYGTPWLRDTWGAKSIVFYQTRRGGVPLLPYVQAPLAPMVGKDGGVDGKPAGDADDEDEYGDPDLMRDFHPCPCLVTFAVVLLELYFAKPFHLLAETYGVELGEDEQDALDGSSPSPNTSDGEGESASGVSGSAAPPPLPGYRYPDVLEVFEKCRFEIPENSKFPTAIDRCLDREIWLAEDDDEEGDDGDSASDMYEERPLDDAAVRAQFVQNVVAPLEEDLRQAFSYFQIDSLDADAVRLDFGNYGGPMAPSSDTSHPEDPKATTAGDHEHPPAQPQHQPQENFYSHHNGHHGPRDRKWWPREHHPHARGRLMLPTPASPRGGFGWGAPGGGHNGNMMMPDFRDPRAWAGGGRHRARFDNRANVANEALNQFIFGPMNTYMDGKPKKVS